MNVVRLRGRKQQPVDAPRADEAREPACDTGAKRAEHGGECAFEFGNRVRSAVQRAEHVHQNDLSVEPAEMLAKERAHHMRDIAVVAPRHHRGEAAALRHAVLIERKREEG